jgi:hypothetical protein
MLVYEKVKESLKQFHFNGIYENYKNELNILKKYIIENFYLLIDSFFERIYISKFNEFYIQNISTIKIDLQYAIRSTSHI